MDEFAWDKNKHDVAHPETKRSQLACKCGGRAFVEVRRLEAVQTGNEAQLDIIALGLLCTKCQSLFNPAALLKAVLSEGKRPDLKLAPEIKKD